MAITFYSESEVARLRRAGRAAAETLAFVGERIRAGITTADIDRWVREDTARRGGRPSQLGYRAHGSPPFPAAVCTSVNHVVCHGVPSPRVVLAAGDIVNVDVTTELDGFHGDTSATFIVGATNADAEQVSGPTNTDAQRIVDVARRCRDAGIEVIREGARLGDVGAAIGELAAREGCSVVSDFGGHGIGRRMHEDPHVPHVAPRGSGIRLRTGMVFTVEPMVNLGAPEVQVLGDGWTVVTADRRLSAQFEHTVLVTRDGYELLTSLGPPTA